MEEDPLVSEEAEPPGSIDCPQGLESPRESILAFPDKIIYPTALSAKALLQVESLQENPRSRAFRACFFPQATLSDWQDWRWQFRNRITEAGKLAKMIDLSEAERRAVEYGGALPMAITPYYASLLDGHDFTQPLRRTVIPTLDELAACSGEKEDPLEEERDSPVPGIVHRYPDRVLFLVTGACSTYCRYCTRSRMVGRRVCRPDMEKWERGIAYIASNPAIRDVLLSGGDPLTLSDERLKWLLSRLRMIPHVEILRIGTKVPAVMPQRITPALTRILKRFHPLWISIHATHPEELTTEMAQACTRLADAGIPLGSQTVLLKGINDDTEVMKRLVQGLMRMRVRPYYLYQCDPIPGSQHFRTAVSKGLEIIEGLRGHTTGYAVPSYVIDAPGGGGKIPLLPGYFVGREGDEIVLRNYAGGLYRYPDSTGPSGEIH